VRSRITVNIVRLVSRFPSPKEIAYGLGPTFYHLTREQDKLGVNVHIICKRPPSLKKLERMNGIIVHRVKSPYNLTMLYEILKINREMKVDLIHAHATSGFSYGLLQRVGVGRCFGRFFVAHAHGTTKGILNAWKKIRSDLGEDIPEDIGFRVFRSMVRESIMWRSADAVLTNSNFLSREIANLYGVAQKRIYVVHNGVDLQTFYPRDSRQRIFKRLGLHSKSHLILYLGGFRPVKGPAYVLDAFKKIHQRNRNIKLLFVGGHAPLDEIFKDATVKTVQALRKKGVLHSISNIPHFRLPEYYSAADAIVVPSIYDAFPKVIMEAMACNTPVIASDAGGIPEIVYHEKTGLLVRPANSNELTEAVERVIRNRYLKEAITDDARKLVEQKFTWKIAAKRTLEVYEQLLAS
jgi:glycosyltransferase involved in cell wall biosynthesis